MARNNIYFLSFYMILTLANTLCATQCPNKCGNVTIEYPFGLGEDCALSAEFVLACDIEEGKIYTVYEQSITILEITHTQITIVGTPIASSCENDDRHSFGFGTSANFEGIGSPYVLSKKDNVFMIVGCNHYGLLNSKTRAGRKLTSCIAICTEKNDLLDGSCSGIGCCQARIPKGLQTFNASLERIAAYNSTLPTVKCSYSFLAKRSSLTFRRAIEVESPKFVKKVNGLPVVFDWFIPNSTCREYSRNKTGYICKQNTICVDVEHELDVNGYRCKCHPGFVGNPYVDGGCKDINECKGPSNPCFHICTNTEGSYVCSCRKGYHSEGSMCFLDKKSLLLPIALGIAFGTVLFVVGGYWLLIVAKKRRQTIEKARNFKRNGGLLLEQQLSSSDGTIERTRVFTQAQLNKATDEFSEDRILGQGGQGAVYKGMMTDGNVVAIKRSKTVGQNRVAEFINELVLLSQLNHRSIVKLLGCCLETETPMLVYEFVPNGTLSRLLHEPSDDLELTWRMRLQIAIDIAGALSYLHTSSSTPILHRDVKTDNILLDAKYRAKLSDFGISRSFGIDQSHITTTTAQGTFGYLDPECHATRQYTDKTDVYAFGVVLVELLTGCKAIMPTEVYEDKSLVWWFRDVMENDRLFDVIDSKVAREGIDEAAIGIAKLARRCINKDSYMRPSMREILVELERIKSLEASTSA